MRRIVALLAVAVVVWMVLRGESALTTEGGSANSTNAATSPEPPVASADAGTNDGVSPGAGRASNRGSAAQRSSANSGKGFRDRAHLADHFDKHGGEFPGLSKAQYLSMAQSLRDAPAGGDILEMARASDGVIARFDRRSGAFLAFDGDGTIRTFFKPNDGEKYFRRQGNRAPGR